MTRTLVVLGLLLLSACASVSYEEPASGERARVRFGIDSSVTDLTVVRSYQDAECNDEREWLRLVNGFTLRQDIRRLGLPETVQFHENGMQELYVDAGRPLYFMFEGSSTRSGIYTSTTYSCGVPVAVSLEPNQDYELVLTSGLQRCFVTFSRIPGGNKDRRDVIRVFQNIDVSQGCRQAFERGRWF
jgi:hypothetical protein